MPKGPEKGAEWGQLRADHERDNCDKDHERCPGLCLSDQAASGIGIPGSQRNIA